MSDSFAAAPRLEIGRVIRQAFGAIGRNAVAIFGLSLAVNVLSILLSFPLKSVNAAAGGDPVWGPLISGGAGGAVGLCLNALLLTCVTVIVIDDLNGQQRGIGRALSASTRLFLPVLVLNLVVALGLMVGTVLLVVPAFILMIRWAVVVPVRVVEGPGLRAALSRSAALTRGYRWPLFFLLVAYIVLAVVLSFVPMAFTGGFLETAVRRAAFDPVATILALLTSVLLSAASTAITAAAYTELRRIKEGAMPSQLAAVFD